jgi:hypothetical protein
MFAGGAYSRRKAFMGYKCQLWKSSGGRKGSTVITNGSGRTFIRKYGKIQSNSTVPVQLRYHQYVEVDKKTQLECGPRVFFIPKRLSRSKPNGSADPGLALGGRGADAGRPVQPQNRILMLAARALNAKGQPRVTLSLR